MSVLLSYGEYFETEVNLLNVDNLVNVVNVIHLDPQLSGFLVGMARSGIH